MKKLLPVLAALATVSAAEDVAVYSRKTAYPAGRITVVAFANENGSGVKYVDKRTSQGVSYINNIGPKDKTPLDSVCYVDALDREYECKKPSAAQFAAFEGVKKDVKQ